ncbi:MAG: hypothetical protein BVN35_21130 [Proteobacteria bacterium ST_bin11]|nr:MAG: hypothetical protein BVN35_21130 [Proteobacteria bacterium ST_bin11]
MLPELKKIRGDSPKIRGAVNSRFFNGQTAIQAVLGKKPLLPGKIRGDPPDFRAGRGACKAYAAWV